MPGTAMIPPLPAGKKTDVIGGTRALFARCLAVATLAGLAGCAGEDRSREATPLRPVDVKAQIASLLPASTADRQGWATDIYGAMKALDVPTSLSNICAVLAVTEQESTFRADPAVPGLNRIAWEEIDRRAARLGVPKFAVRAALSLSSSTGKSYGERIDAVHSERELSEIFEDFIGLVPLGKKMFAGWNPVRTGGPMQVSIAFAEAHAKQKDYPYPVSESIRHEVFTRRGGLYFGIAHLLDYPATYDKHLYRFADFNAGRYASRNAAFQNALGKASGQPLDLDGDLIQPGSEGEVNAGSTELAARSLAKRLDMSQSVIRRTLEQGDSPSFERSTLYKRVFELAEQAGGRPLPRALLPRIQLQSPKITRKLTTEWFANRVDERYRRCLANN